MIRVGIPRVVMSYGTGDYPPIDISIFFAKLNKIKVYNYYNESVRSAH